MNTFTIFHTLLLSLFLLLTFFTVVEEYSFRFPTLSFGGLTTSSPTPNSFSTYFGAQWYSSWISPKFQTSVHSWLSSMVPSFSSFYYSSTPRFYLYAMHATWLDKGFHQANITTDIQVLMSLIASLIAQYAKLLNHFAGILALVVLIVAKCLAAVKAVHYILILGIVLHFKWLRNKTTSENNVAKVLTVEQLDESFLEEMKELKAFVKGLEKYNETNSKLISMLFKDHMELKDMVIKSSSELSLLLKHLPE